MVDSLGAGGAQRQVVSLASKLSSLEYEIELLNYYPNINFFRNELLSYNIKIYDIQKNSRFTLKIIFYIIYLLKRNRYDCVISFLDTPNLYCEIAKLLSFSRVFLVVSERSSRYYVKKRLNKICHMLANKVVANSYDHGDWLKSFPYLKRKVITIYNGYEITKKFITKTKSHNYNFLVIGRIDKGKNGLNLIKALAKISRKNSPLPSIQWVGSETSSKESLSYRKQMDELLSKHPKVLNNWEWMGHRKDINRLLEQADALIHISLYEGLPNAICEALVAGRPVIASNVCDHPRLVEDNIRGILCDPVSVESICSAIERFVNLTSEERLKMGINARRYAEQHLSIDRMVSEYEKLLILN